MKTLLPESFQEQLTESKEGLMYLNLIQTAKSRILPEDTVIEIHHIHPRGLGGKVRDKANLVHLTVFEHCIAHALLAVAIPCYETAVPLNLISGAQVKSLSDLEQTSLEEIYRWSEIREKSRYLVGKKGRVPWNKGKKMSVEYRKKISDSHKTSPRHFTREQLRLRGEKISASKKGKPGRKHSEEERLQQSQRNRERGIKPPNRQGRKNSEIHKLRISEALKGRVCPSKETVWVSRENVHRRVQIPEVENFIKQGFHLGKK